MFPHKITYVNFDGVEVSEEFHFGISKIQLIELEMSYEGSDSLQEHINRLIKSENNLEIFQIFQKIIKMSVGTRIGDRFVKNEDILGAFAETNAFDAVVMEMFQNPKWAGEFIGNILPGDLAKQLEESQKKPTEEELLGMSNKKFFKAVGQDRTKWSKETNEIFHKRRKIRDLTAS